MGKEVIILDIDNTIKPSGVKVGTEMAKTLKAVVDAGYWLVFVSGVEFRVIKQDVLDFFAITPQVKKRVIVFSTTGAEMHLFDGSAWKTVYTNPLKSDEKTGIVNAINTVIKEHKKIIPFQGARLSVQDRKCQYTVSLLNHSTSRRIKTSWDRKMVKRKLIQHDLEKRLKGFEVNLSGHASLDITRKGLDKAYAVKRLKQHLKLPSSRMIFFGDSVFRGGNDYSVKKSGVKAVKIKDEKETLKILKKLL